MKESAPWLICFWCCLKNIPEKVLAIIPIKSRIGEPDSDHFLAFFDLNTCLDEKIVKEISNLSDGGNCFDQSTRNVILSNWFYNNHGDVASPVLPGVETMLNRLPLNSG